MSGAVLFGRKRIEEMAQEVPSSPTGSQQVPSASDDNTFTEGQSVHHLGEAKPTPLVEPCSLILYALLAPGSLMWKVSVSGGPVVIYTTHLAQKQKKRALKLCPGRILCH